MGAFITLASVIDRQALAGGVGWAGALGLVAALAFSLRPRVVPVVVGVALTLLVVERHGTTDERELGLVIFALTLLASGALAHAVWRDEPRGSRPRSRIGACWVLGFVAAALCAMSAVQLILTGDVLFQRGEVLPQHLHVGGTDALVRGQGGQLIGLAAAASLAMFLIPFWAKPLKRETLGWGTNQPCDLTGAGLSALCWVIVADAVSAPGGSAALLVIAGLAGIATWFGFRQLAAHSATLSMWGSPWLLAVFAVALALGWILVAGTGQTPLASMVLAVTPLSFVGWRLIRFGLSELRGRNSPRAPGDHGIEQ